MKIKFQWEDIDGDVADYGDNVMHETHRSKTIGGWIVRSRSLFGIDDSESLSWQNASESMVFIPDPTHLWEIEES